MNVVLNLGDECPQKGFTNGVGRAGFLSSFTVTRKEAGLFCGSFLRKSEAFAFVESIQNLNDLKK